MNQTDDVLAEAERLIEADEGARALARLDGRDGPEAALLRARAHLLGAASAPAAQALLEACTDGADPEAVAEVHALFDPRDFPPEAEAAILDWIVARAETFPRVLRLARVRTRLREPGPAEEAARRAVALQPASAIGHRLVFLSVLRSETPERAVDAIRDALASPCGNPKYPALKVTLAGLETADRKELTAAIAERWPDALGTGPRGGDLSLPGQRGPKASREHRAYDLVLRGERDEAMEIARALEASNTGRHSSIRKEMAPRIVPLVPGPGDWRRPLIEDDGSEVLRSAPSLTGVTMLGMTDLAHQLGYPVRVIDAFCARAGAASLFLRDHSYLLFMNGVETLASDRAGTLEALRRELMALGTERLVVICQSSGAFSGISYGRELGAAAIYGMGAATSVERFVKGPDTRAPALTAKLWRRFPPEMMHLARILPGLPSRAPIELHYGADREIDRGHAEDLEGIEGVTLHPRPGYAHHQVLPPLIEEGTFQSWLEP